MKIICLVILLMSLAVFADCIEITEDLDLDDDNESCFIITENDVTFDCGGNTICEEGGNTCITIDATGVKITDCVIEGDDDETAIEVNEDEATIEDCEIDNSDIAVDLENAEDCSLENLEISNSNKGVYIKNSDGADLDGIDITNTDPGISISSSSDVSLKDITVENDDYKSYYMRFKVEDEDEDPIEEAEVTLEASEGSDPFNNEETDEDGYTEWKEVHVIEYDEDNETDITFILTVEYGDADYEEEDFEVSETETITIELDADVEAEEDELTQLNATCTSNSDCASGYCCLQGDFKFTCKSGPAYCPVWECTQDDDCDDDEECEDHGCIAITGICGYADDHEWVEYECCEDSECSTDEECEDNICKKLDCDCGTIKDHECEAECCTNKECPEGYECMNMVCSPGNACSLNSECANTEKCIDSFCEEITGSCGYAFEHRWISYECCTNTDCPEGTTCDENTCVDIKEEETGGFCASGFIILSTIFLGLYIKRD